MILSSDDIISFVVLGTNGTRLLLCPWSFLEHSVWSNPDHTFQLPGMCMASFPDPNQLEPGNETSMCMYGQAGEQEQWMMYILHHQVNKAGLKVRGALITEVYRKALYVNSTTLSEFSTGQVEI